MHKAPYDNQNRAIVDRADPVTPLVYFNIVKLSAGERFVSTVEGYETCLVPVSYTHLTLPTICSV